MNQLLAASNGEMQFWMAGEGFENLAIDIQTEKPVLVTSKYFGMGMDGTFFNVLKGE